MTETAPTQEPVGGPRRFVVVDEAMDAAFAAELLAYAIARESDFSPAGVHDRGGEPKVVAKTRECVRLADLAQFRGPFAEAVEKLAPSAAADLGLDVRLTVAEFEICAYGDGNFFRRHQDLVQVPGSIRALTCTYYFSRSPSSFQGGELRLHPWPRPLPGSELPLVDIEPRFNRMVFIPSMLPHEVRPVRTTTSRWEDRRFNLTCWLWRATSAHR